MTDESATHDALDVTYPAFNPTVVPAQVDENTLHVRAGPWSGPILTLRDADEDDGITALVDRIDGETHVEDVLEGFEGAEREEVLDALAALAENDVVYDASDDADPLHHHLAMRHRFRAADADRVASKTVALVGDARMVRHVAEDVLALGVGDVGVVSLDDATAGGGATVGEDASTAGGDAARVEVDGVAGGDAFAYVRDDDRFEVFERDALHEVVAAADFVVYAGTRPRPTLLADLNEATHEAGTPWVLGQALGFDGVVGPAVFPGETACYECFERRTLANVANREGYLGYRDAVEVDDHLAARSLPMLERAVAGYLSLDLVHLLAFGVGFTAGAVVTVNALDCATTTEDVLRLPRCPTCGVDPDDGHSPFVSLDDVVHADRIRGSTETARGGD
ncbi:TOMM precursor leader peptide-binding protein [Halorubellus litoreus]|uniref:TOMM leader peptide-binding protein n=1 Tax=Halorubellus litoreus TaxID=755308 RepID=A0ABD5VB55_9EURY